MTPETIIKNQVKDYLKLKGIFYYHNLQGIGAYKGIPDLIAVKGGLYYGLEIKRPTGKQSEYQVEFQKKLEKAGGKYLLISSLEDIMKVF